MSPTSTPASRRPCPPSPQPYLRVYADRDTKAFELSLKRTQHCNDDDMDRKLVVSNETAVQVGRASKTEHKQLVPAVDNAWIRNPVISRTHAEISVSDFLGTPSVNIRDLKSSHGTWVNGRSIGDEKHSLKTGDRLQFGTNVMRGEGKFSSLSIDCFR
jgi:hypothetical protein